MDNSALNDKKWFFKNEMNGMSVDSNSFLELRFQQVLKVVLPPFLAHCNSNLLFSYLEQDWQ